MTSKVAYLGELRTECTHILSGQTFITDAPPDNQGRGEAISPTDMTATSLAACILTTIGIRVRELDITGAYADLTGDRARLAALVAQLRPLHPAERIAGWLAQAEAGDFAALAEGLMQAHYDPRYARHRSRMPAPVAGITAATLEPGDLPALAAKVAQAVQRLDA